jgi:hypothetical protein
MEAKVKHRGTKKPTPPPGASTMFEKARFDLEQDPVTPGAVTATHITGTTGVPWQPPQPEGSPWKDDPLGDEQPLGEDINALPDMTRFNG